MKKLFIYATVISLLSCNNDKKDSSTTSSAIDSSATTAAGKPADTTMVTPPDSATMAKAWQAYMTPGEEQKRMAMANGKWSEDMTMYMAGAAPQMMKSDCENSMILNGLYQKSEHHGNYMGMKFEGISTMAYNIAAKKYQSTWIDNMGSGMMNMEGEYDSTSKTYNMKGTETDPVTGKDIPVRETFKLMDDKNQYMEMFETRGGKEAKVMEIKFTKQ